MSEDVAVPVAFPDFKAHSDEINRGIPSGHAGILFIDGSHGTTNYYEYGRYDPPANKGIVRKVVVPDVKLFGGVPTRHSFETVLSVLSKKSGHDGRVLVAYMRVKDGGFEKMKSYCIRKLHDNKNPKREPYSLVDNNCCTFARDVAAAGGALPPGTASRLRRGYFGTMVDFADPFTISPIPRNFLHQLLFDFPGLEFEPPSTYRSVGLRSLELK